jgi:hypothetical protein
VIIRDRVTHAKIRRSAFDRLRPRAARRISTGACAVLLTLPAVGLVVVLASIFQLHAAIPVACVPTFVAALVLERTTRQVVPAPVPAATARSLRAQAVSRAAAPPPRSLHRGSRVAGRTGIWPWRCPARLALVCIPTAGALLSCPSRAVG